jgi:LysR family glycine cleavage system transcriptional activator
MDTRRLPPLAALKAFEATARHLSAKQAALELSVTPTAVSHQIRQLEAQLGQALFIRQPRQLILTPEGRALFEALRQGFDLMAEGIARLRAGQARPVLTVTTTPALAARWLMPRFGSFRAAHPEQDLKVHASYEVVPLDGRTADVAIRYGRGDWPGMAAEKLFDLSFVPACSPRLQLRRPEDLLAQTLIHYEWQPGFVAPADWRAWRRAAGLKALNTAGGLMFSDESHAVSAAIAGHGVVLMGRLSIADELRSGVLVQPFGPELPGDAYYLVYPEKRRGDAQIETVRRWIASLA